VPAEDAGARLKLGNMDALNRLGLPLKVSVFSFFSPFLSFLFSEFSC
jgi:hypothetical protein